MATLASNLLTLADITKRTDPQGKPAAIAELLSQSRGIINDIPWVEGNLPNGHEVTLRTSLPTVSMRTANSSVTPTKSSTAQSTEVCGRMEAWTEVDEIVAERGGNPAAVRFSEATAHIEAMGQKLEDLLFYGNHTTTPTEFTGLAQRYSSLTGTYSDNIVTAGGSGSDNSSIWIVGWAPGKVYGIYPKGSTAGLSHKDWGKQVITDTAGIGNGRLAAYRDQYSWDCGIAVEDWRYVVRIPNVDISNLVGKSSAADLFDKLIMGYHSIANIEACNPVIYMNRTCLQMLDIQSRDDSVYGLTSETVDGKVKKSFRGIPVRIADRLVQNEAAIS